MKGKEAIVNAGMFPIFSQHLHNPDPINQQLSLSTLMLLCVLTAAKKEAIEVPSLVDDLLYIIVVTQSDEQGGQVRLLMEFFSVKKNSFYFSLKDDLKYKYAKSILTLICEYPAAKKQIEKCISKYGGDKEAVLYKSLFPK